MRPEDILAWDPPEIRGAIDKRLPDGWEFKYSFNNGWSVWFERYEDGVPDPIIEWADTALDERIALLNAFGYLWMRTQNKPEANSPWHRRRELTTEYVRRKAMELADPPDVDPDEVRAVYEEARGKK